MSKAAPSSEEPIPAADVVAALPLATDREFAPASLMGGGISQERPGEVNRAPLEFIGGL